MRPDILVTVFVFLVVAYMLYQIVCMVTKGEGVLVPANGRPSKLPASEPERVEFTANGVERWAAYEREHTGFEQYRVTAEKGQRLGVSLESESELFFSVWDEQSQQLLGLAASIPSGSSWGGDLPAAGSYIVSVYGGDPPAHYALAIVMQPSYEHEQPPLAVDSTMTEASGVQ
jgi:hypothetical protein